LPPHHILMSYLPSMAWAEMATKHDLRELEDRLTRRFEATLYRELQATTRTYVLANIALVFTVAAIAFGAAKLV
jgi:hypothetical protein